MTDAAARTTRPEVRGEPRLLIDGKLVEARGGGSFANIDPATEESLGDTADGTTADMAVAIAAARRAFDETSWATDPAFPRRCPEQFPAAIEANKEELRHIVVAEVGSPLMLTYIMQ